MWHHFKRFVWESRGIWITAPSITGLVILIRFTGLFQAWEWGVYDQYMRMRPSEPQDLRIGIVGIDEADIENLGQANISDAVYAELLTKLRAMEPRAIGLDIYRNLPEPPGHEELIEVFQTTPQLVGIQKVAGEKGRETVAPPPALAELGQVGANDLIFDADDRARRALMHLTDQEGNIVYSFALHLALLYLKAEEIAPEAIDPNNNNIWRLGKATFSPLNTNDGGYIRTDASGYQFLINYRGPSRSFETVSMTDILEEKVPADWGEDRVILIGKVGESFKDLFNTPYSSNLISLPEPVAGVEVHANITSQIISAALEGRPLFRSWSSLQEWLWILTWAVVGSSLSWMLRYVGRTRLISWRVISGPILASGVLMGVTYFLFLDGLWVPVVPPLLALSGSVAAITTHIARTAGDIRKTFGRYLSDSIVTTLLESPEGLKMGGERRKITILTSDLRGFTATAERISPEEVVKILNLYLGYMADVITSYQGTIDEFMGDGILVLFGAPMSREDDAQRAVACGVAMQLAMTSVNQKMQELGLPKLQMGIGINTGEVIVGNIGSEKRAKYGVVGSQVNLTYRIESYTTSGQILISESTWLGAGEIVKISGKKQVKPKGVPEPISIYEVEGIGGKYNLFLPQETESFLKLTEQVNLHYSVLDGKNIEETLHKGCLVELSQKGGLIRWEVTEEGEDSLECIPPALTNIKLNFWIKDEFNEFSEDIYAKVIEREVNQAKCFYVHFTAKPPEIETMLEKLYQVLSEALGESQTS